VTVDTPYDSEVAALADVLIISGEFRKSHYPSTNKEALFQQYLQHTNAIIVFTSGQELIIYGKKGERPHYVPAFQVDTIDTAGAGDSFRSGIIYGLLQKWELERTVHFAAALAAMICTKFPGVINSPTYDEIIHFMNQQHN
jgi:sugar/nucleoside kinase (ribokinase family)